MSAPLELRTLYRDGRLLPFVGAGVSASVEWGKDGEKRGPSWAELVDRAALELGFQQPDLIRARGTDLQSQVQRSHTADELASIEHEAAR